MENKKKSLIKLFLIGVAIFLGMIILFGSFRIISPSERGLKIRLGRVSENILGSGVHFKLPLIDKIEKYTLEPITLDHVVVVGNDGAITKDNQTIGAELKVFYKYNQAELINLRENYGKKQVENIILQSLRESFKSAIGGYDIFQLPVNQDEIRKNVFNSMTEKLSSYPVQLTELKITNYDWSDEFDERIQKTMAAAQQVKQKEQELLISEQEAQKIVKQAEAEKERARLMAEAKELEGNGIKKYNEAVQSNMNLEIKLRELEIERLRVEKWNGIYVPTNNYTPIPFDTGVLQGR